MISPILFRSLRSGKNQSGVANMTIRQRGSSWSHLRPYTHTDDIRDIAWRKIKPEGISVRARETQGDFNIISYWDTSTFDDFFDRDPLLSKKNSINKIQEIIAGSAKYGGYSYRELYGKEGIKKLLQLRPTNTLIFINNPTSNEGLDALAFHNDLIYIDSIHPFEMNPNTGLLFSGQTIDIRSYKRAYEQDKKSLQAYIRKIRASYIKISTDEDIVRTLNLFFKKRYTHG